MMAVILERSGDVNKKDAHRTANKEVQSGTNKAAHECTASVSYAATPNDQNNNRRISRHDCNTNVSWQGSQLLFHARTQTNPTTPPMQLD